MAFAGMALRCLFPHLNWCVKLYSVVLMEMGFVVCPSPSKRTIRCRVNSVTGKVVGGTQVMQLFKLSVSPYPQLLTAVWAYLGWPSSLCCQSMLFAACLFALHLQGSLNVFFDRVWFLTSDMAKPLLFSFLHIIKQGDSWTARSFATCNSWPPGHHYLVIFGHKCK